MTRLSVVIPTRNRPQLLSETLACLGGQTFRDLEVVVVDDDSDEPVDADGAAAAGIPVACLRQERAGASAARNLGARAATGDLLAFLDDDLVVPPGWAHAVVRGFEELACEGIAGPIGLRFEGRRPPWLADGLRHLLGELDLGGTLRLLDHGFIPNGGNCAVTRGAFEATGGWAAGYHLRDNDQGKAVVANEEWGLFRRLEGRGGRLGWVPGAAVLHRVFPERLDPAYMAERAFAQGVANVRLDSARLTPARRLREQVRFGRALAILAKDLPSGHGTAGARVWLGYCQGRMTALRSRKERDS